LKRLGGRLPAESKIFKIIPCRPLYNAEKPTAKYKITEEPLRRPTKRSASAIQKLKAILEFSYDFYCVNQRELFLTFMIDLANQRYAQNQM
jgi:hypothetical protein